MKTTLSHSTIDVRTLHARIQAGETPELLDVRTPPEHAAGHVPGVKLLPLDELDAVAFLRQRAQSGQPLYLLCQTGGRAQRALEKFQQAGFERGVLVTGGTAAWAEAGLPLNRGTSRVIPLMRQVQIIVGGLSAAGALLALTVNVRFALIPLVTGCGLLFAGCTGFCGLALVLAKLPWNRSATGASCARD
jgi:rhodanese-related sulfurtransferase